MSRGIISIYWGDETKLPIERLKASLKRFHPELPHEIFKIEAPVGDDSSLNRKAVMHEMTPFDETLYLDIDTVVMGNLDFGFEKARAHGLALVINECPWAKRYHKIFNGDQIEYNTGVMFFTKQVAPVFESWAALSRTVDSQLALVKDGTPLIMKANDQGPFALAVEQTGFNPFTLPLNWNFRPMYYKSFFGPIKIWHDNANPPPMIEKFNSDYAKPGAIMQFHVAGGPPPRA